MTTTYYLLRVKTSAQGDGAYLGVDTNATPALVASSATARRFASIEEAELAAAGTGPELGGFEIEVRNTVN